MDLKSRLPVEWRIDKTARRLIQSMIDCQSSNMSRMMRTIHHAHLSYCSGWLSHRRQQKQQMKFIKDRFDRRRLIRQIYKWKIKNGIKIWRVNLYPLKARRDRRVYYGFMASFCIPTHFLVGHFIYHLPFRVVIIKRAMISLLAISCALYNWYVANWR